MPRKKGKGRGQQSEAAQVLPVGAQPEAPPEPRPIPGAAPPVQAPGRQVGAQPAASGPSPPVQAPGRQVGAQPAASGPSTAGAQGEQIAPPRPAWGPKQKALGRGRGRAPDQSPQVVQIQHQPAQQTKAPPPPEYHDVPKAGRERAPDQSPQVAQIQHQPAQQTKAQPAPEYSEVPIPAATQPPEQGGASAQVTAVAQILSKVSIPSKQSQLMLPTRPGFGKAGRLIKLVSNHYPMNIPEGFIYHYDVEIEQLRSKELTPEEQAKEVKKKATPQQVSGRRLSVNISRDVMQRLFAQEPMFRGMLPAYDGNKSMFTRKSLNIGERVTKLVIFKEDGRDIDSKFKVSIQPVEKDGYSNVIDMNCLHELFRGRSGRMVECYQAIMALDIIMRAGPALKLNQIGRSFFLRPRSQQEVHPLSKGKQVWFGHYQTIRPAQWKPTIILDKSATTFFKPGPVIDYCCEILSTDRMRFRPEDLVKLKDSQTKVLSNDLRNVQICVTHLPYRRRYRIVRITRLSAIDLTFPEKQADGKIVKKSVADYFRQNYKPLNFPNLPCVQVNPENKNIYQPMEVCELIEGQHYKKKLSEDQTSQMIKFTCTTPGDRFRDIQQSAKETFDNSARYMKEFGIKIENNPLYLNGRVINAPKVLYGNEKVIQPINGTWDLRQTKFFQGAEIKSWAILCMASDRFCPPNNLQKFADMVKSVSQTMGMRMGPLKDMCYYPNRGIPAVLQQMKEKNGKLDLVIIVLNDRDSYQVIKQVAEVQLGMLTSCIQVNNVKFKCNPQLVCNVLQKINAKLGGQNSRLLNNEIAPILHKPVLIIGADVSHSAPGDRVKPSVAAAVGSLDNVLHHYAACIRLQKNRSEDKQHLEIIADLKGMVRTLLVAFYKKTGFKPEKIILYRDGVSEGEFSTVQQYELQQIRETCLELEKSGSYKPGITFVVVQKRHHTRFRPENSQEGVGKCKNVPPGTTVDTDVTSPVDHDFFLCSHFGIQGTSRPAHYTVLWDDNNLTADELQKLSYQLCHTYVRCTRSISIPAPVMYAHLAALRARQHLASAMGGHSSAESDVSSYEEDSITAEFENAVKVIDDIGKTMYFV